MMILLITTVTHTKAILKLRATIVGIVVRCSMTLDGFPIQSYLYTTFNLNHLAEYKLNKLVSDVARDAASFAA